ncbi:HlyD family efflux transporter periplasmic adaptor subunit [Duganella sp. BJB488]|uniref:efflux RND transporter periplasmic adaptor subunit n=1 Tax=unclassified Duganella TaxID=2636909 RepID=UPI000E34147C|nr:MULTISPECIES: efflux RND transporter periplasmic adaptor subunit [unclassified Duganella]RFP24295.1 HlyD family efflux transporter periplasmic adaptor subunit [Duganella sp. BJB489]RFP26656.1 HlyD family efflux transporter periplasmic adaptor subunit [Duganella sp. BJB488]RFP34612.1 HlyD family efflux transporter periplasmic adaptor subunit [Duganella sp. BJB480]
MMYPPSPAALLRLLALASLLAGPARAWSAEAVAQLPMSAKQISRAGIATAPAVAAQAGAATSVGDAVVLSGTVVAPADAVVLAAAAAGGVVQQVHSVSLQRVRTGSALATLFSPAWMETQREYVQLSTQSRLAADKRQRDESLFAEGVISRARVEESRAAAQLARLAADQRAQMLRAGGLDAAAIQALSAGAQPSPLLTVRAQSAGTLIELPVTVGQQLDAGMAVAKISRDGALWVELQASARQMSMLAVGDLLDVAQCGQLRIIALSPQVNSANQTAQVRARQLEPQGCLKINAFVEARLVRPPAQGASLLVPAAALVRRGTANYVFVRNAAGFQAVPVVSGAAAGDQLWVRGAIAPGAQVAVRGLVALKGAWAGLGEPAGAPAPQGKP